jgi:hypothetical protein
VGLTVIVKVSAVPAQLTEPFVKVGVTVIVALIGEVPALVAVNVAMLPVPFAPRPMAVLLFDQAYVVVPPVRLVAKLMAPLAPLLQSTILAGSVTCADGLTVIVNVSAGPTQLTDPFVKVGVTVIVALIGDVPEFVALNDAILPEPLATSPIAVLLFDHEYVVVPPVRLVAKVIIPLAAELHRTISAGSVTWAVGLTVIVNVSAGPTQLTEPLVKVGVTVIVALMGDVPALVAVNEAMLPVPFAPRPIAVLLFDHAYVVVPPVRFVVNDIIPLAPLLQSTISTGSFT